MSVGSLRVAAVQMVSVNGERNANLERAAYWVQQASDAGAKLMVLPELFSGGYWLSEQAWDTAEPQDGPTESWLRETAQRLGIYFGGSYLQARGEDFFNVFALATPAGKIAGRRGFGEEPSSRDAGRLKLNLQRDGNSSVHNSPGRRRYRSFDPWHLSMPCGGDRDIRVSAAPHRNAIYGRRTRRWKSRRSLRSRSVDRVMLMARISRKAGMRASAASRSNSLL